MNWRFDRDRTTSFSRFMWQRFIDDKCFETAGALSYTTLVSLVPLTVAVLAMFSAFPVFAEWRNTLINFVFNFVPAAADTVKNTLLAFADNASKLTGISVIVMLFSAVSMMISIEDRLNRIWRVHQPRGWGPRLLLYWAALTLGPILVVGGLAASSYVTALPLLKSAVEQLSFGARLLGLLPFVVTFITLWLLYTVVPNRRVSLKHAAVGAALGAVLFEIARWGFELFVRHAQTYQQIYGAALAALPILLLWIYLSWIIVILGASIAASISAYEYQVPSECLPEGSEFLGLLVVLRHFVEAQRNGESVDVATVRMQEPYLRSASITVFFDDLQRADLIQRSETGGWLLSRSLDATDLLRVYRHAGYRLPLHPVQEAQALSIQLPDELLQLLDKVADMLKGTLGTKLDQAYPPPIESKEIVV
ncbi:YihY family inner membrane protein [Dyella subtropica]|uniref:YihY family inner membrane protein n=1 Tax=Dyella subtropica TaxID=2992127 RepID=UPI00224EE3A0|nr:YihY family inner membrane protein [Dyella subtropica]